MIDLTTEVKNDCEIGSIHVTTCLQTLLLRDQNFDPNYDRKVENYLYRTA